MLTYGNVTTKIRKKIEKGIGYAWAETLIPVIV